MNFAVKTYASAPADLPEVVAGIPLDWPMEIRDLGESTELPEGTGWILMSEIELVDYKAIHRSAYDIWYAATYPINPHIAVERIIGNAQNFGLKLIKEVAAENILLGITQAGKTNFVRKATNEVMLALMSGSLYDAIYEIRQIPPEKKDEVFLTDARLLQYINKIEAYLGISLSTQL